MNSGIDTFVEIPKEFENHKKFLEERRKKISVVGMHDQTGKKLNIAIKPKNKKNE